MLTYDHCKLKHLRLNRPGSLAEQLWALHRPALEAVYICTPVHIRPAPTARHCNYGLSVPAPSCAQWFLMIWVLSFLCQIHTRSSFLNFNIINHLTFNISELRNLHFYNGGFERRTQMQMLPKLCKNFRKLPKQTISTPLTVNILSSSQRQSIRDF